MNPDAILPVASFAAGGLCLGAACLVAYSAQRAASCMRAAFYSALSAGLTIAGAGLMFGNLIAAFIHH